MTIVVCIKQVPQEDSVDIDKITGNLKRHTGQQRMNPYDVQALTAALTLREAYCRKYQQTEEDIRLVAMSMGPESALKMLRDALSMGADMAILLSDMAFSGADVLATSRVICQAIQMLEDVALVIFGVKTTDGDTGQVGPETARLLGIPCVYQAGNITLDETSLQFVRNLSEVRQWGEVDLPCAVCVLPEAYSVKAVQLKQKIEARKKPCYVWDQAKLQICQPGVMGSATRVRRIYPSQQLYKGRCFEGDGDHLMDFLQQEVIRAHKVNSNKVEVH